MKRFRPTLCLLSLFWALLSGTISAQQAPEQAVVVLTIDGAIGPAVSRYLIDGIAHARDNGAYMVVIRMDTPGGLDTSMRDIIRTILASDIPVASFVTPDGARAASAGTYILYASHIAAMAPATNLGAATPVQIGGPSPASPTPADPGSAGEEPDESTPDNSGATASERKAINDARAYIRALAERHDRNADWAELAVTESASLSARQALEQDVIDIVAADLDDLLQQMHGRVVVMQDGMLNLDTQGRTLEMVEMSWNARLLAVVTNPNLIVILGMIGLYGLILEFYSAGFGVGGVVGTICLLLAAYGLQLLPINYAGLGLILLGMALMVAEALVPSFGIMGGGGIVAFLIGGLMLVDTDVDLFQVSTPLLLAVAVFGAGLFIASLRVFNRISHKAPIAGMEDFIGLTGHSVATFEREGMVKVRGELWKVRTDTPLKQGDAVKVLGVDGLRLNVTRIQEV